MRELNACRGVLKDVLQIAREHGATRVERIVLQVGALSGIEPVLLADAFPFVSAGTPAEGAELIIETVNARMRCRTCGAESDGAARLPVCSHCGGDTLLLTGDKVVLAHVELLHPRTAAVLH